jgi:hypothetical protein
VLTVSKQLMPWRITAARRRELLGTQVCKELMALQGVAGPKDTKDG